MFVGAIKMAGNESQGVLIERSAAIMAHVLVYEKMVAL